MLKHKLHKDGIMSAMDKKLLSEVNEPARAKRHVITVVVTVVVILVALLIVWLMQPKPSAEAYCKIYKEEKVRLAKLPGDTWPSGVFNDSVSDAGEFATSFDRLASVAPSDIKPDVVALQKVYQKIADDPSQGMSASLSGIGAESNLKKWTGEHCAE